LVGGVYNTPAKALIAFRPHKKTPLTGF
jgi:hypothetical protein